MNQTRTTAIAADQSIGETVRIVVDKLFVRIQSGEYPPDSRLPSERALAAELGVSRNTVREALDVLESREMVRRRQGSGSFVTFQSYRAEAPLPGSVGERTSPLDHLIVRSIIEPEMTRLAVMNMTPKDLENLAQVVAQIEAVSSAAKRNSTAPSRGRPAIRCLRPVTSWRSMSAARVSAPR